MYGLKLELFQSMTNSAELFEPKTKHSKFRLTKAILKGSVLGA